MWDTQFTRSPVTAPSIGYADAWCADASSYDRSYHFPFSVTYRHVLHHHVLTASMNFLHFSQHSQSNQTGFIGPFLLRSRLKRNRAWADMPTALLLAAWAINERTQNASLSTSPALSASSTWASNFMFSEICLAYTWAFSCCQRKTRLLTHWPILHTWCFVFVLSPPTTFTLNFVLKVAWSEAHVSHILNEHTSLYKAGDSSTWSGRLFLSP